MLACATFCAHYFILSRQARAQVLRERKKNALGLALAFMLSTGRFQDMRCLFLPTLMLTFVVVQLVNTKLLCQNQCPPAPSKVTASFSTCASACVASETVLFTRL